MDTLQNQFSGYGSTSSIVARCLDRLGLKEPLENWSDETVETVVRTFIEEKFPTVFALNKIDHPDADKVRYHLLFMGADIDRSAQNVSQIAKMQDPKAIVLCSAISEVFLRRLAKQNYIKYIEGSEFLDTRDDLIETGDPSGGGLREMDEKLQKYVYLTPRSRLLTSAQPRRKPQRHGPLPLWIYRSGPMSLTRC